MKLTLDIVSDNPTLNSFTVSKSLQLVKGQTAVVILRLFQADKDLRYIPPSSATLTIDLKKSDQSTITKTLTSVFSDDRSVQKFELDANETAAIISQTLTVKITDGADIKFAVLKSGLQKISLNDEGCN